MTQNNNDRDKSIVIVGGGPAGFGAALAFSNNNYKNIIVLEGRKDMSIDLENSYTVGVNVRGQTAIKHLFESKKIEISDIGLRVDQWKIIVGPGINVASFDSGLVLGTSRAEVTNLLYNETQNRNAIKVLFGHKARHVDLKTKKLVCETEDGDKEFSPDALIIADGYKSKVRDIIAESDPSLKIQQWPWHQSFRVLLSEPNPKTELNQYIHYIVNDTYISKFKNGKWSAVLNLKKNSPSFLSSYDATDENVDELMKYVKKVAPSASDLFTKEEYRKFFTRSMFTGAVVKVSKLLIDDWALLLGDAAHSAMPATGEGINSALEDCSILQSCLKGEKSLSDNLRDFEQKRLEDANALSDIAYGVSRSGIKSIFQTLLIQLGQKFNLAGPTKEEYLFGKYSAITKRYSEALAIWKNQTKWIFGADVPKS